MRKLIVSEWMTLDGVIDAGSMEVWFNPYHSDERAAYIKENIDTSGAFLMGRKTFEMLGPYWSSLKNNEMGIAAKFNRAPKYVVSSQSKLFEWNNSTIIKKDVMKEIKKLKKKPGRDILIFGSANLVHSLMETDLIDEYRFLVQPVLMGEGLNFFEEGVIPTKLKLVKSKTMSLGVQLNCYKPIEKIS